MSEGTSSKGQSERDWPEHNAAAALLHIYAHLLLSGEEAAIHYPQVAAHLSKCDECSEDLQILLEDTQSLYAPAVEPSEAAQPELSGLPEPSRNGHTPAKPWRELAGTFWMQLSTVLHTIQRPPALLGAARGGLLYSYSCAAGTNEPGLDLEIYADEGGNMATVVIQITLADGDALSQAGSKVTLFVDGKPRSELTDNSGSVRFTKVPREALERLELEIITARST